MEKITSFEQARKVLEAYVPQARAFRGAYTLERMQKLLDALGSPQSSYKVIHVAGTSGKTSTSYYIAGLISLTGKKVGLTVSPHIDEINERVQVNLIPLEEKVFCKELTEFIKILNTLSIKPTYFELLVAFAYWYFAKAKVDYAVVEVGLGGLLDGTNVVSSKKKVCVITDIGLDHTEILGQTVGEVAAQKAGIIKPYNPVFCYEQADDVMQVIREVASQQQAELHEIKPMKNNDLPEKLPLYQRRNWYLAYKVFNFVAERDELKQLSEAQLEKSSQVYIPARMEIVQRGSKTIIMDGAHNAQKLNTLSKSIKHMFPDEKTATLFSIIQSRNARLQSSLQAVTKFSDAIICTSFETQQDLKKMSASSSKVIHLLERFDFQNVQYQEDPKEALRKLLARPEKLLVITGSFYLLNVIRPILRDL